MKQSEIWAHEWVIAPGGWLKGTDSDVEYTMTKEAWLAGFEFAKRTLSQKCEPTPTPYDLPKILKSEIDNLGNCEVS